MRRLQRPVIVAIQEEQRLAARYRLEHLQQEEEEHVRDHQLPTSGIGHMLVEELI